MTHPPAIDVSHLSFRREDQLILDDVTFAVEAGSYVGVIGPNGGGKTTLLKILLGLHEPTTGTARMFGKPPGEARKDGSMGYVPQRIAQTESFFPSTVEEIVRSGRIAKAGFLHRFSSMDRAALDQAMETTGVAALRKRRIGHLSGGERQRVFIARALASDPKILFLDEPTTGVDIAAKEQFYRLLRELNETRGLTIIFVSHDIEVMTKEAKSVCCLNQKLLCCCSSHTFLHDQSMQKLYGENFAFIQHTH